MRKLFIILATVLALTLLLSAQQWTPLGPDGGDVRTLTQDPFAANRIFLTTSAGQVFESLNGGESWGRLAKLGDRNDYVIDHVIFHPTRAGVVYAAAWSIEDNNRGDFFRSFDGGRSWKPVKDMHGKSIRALAMAPSNPDILVAGALDGVFRSTDGGEHWGLLSPADHPDIRNIESIAIDPADPDAIYAGTWHLPWKTRDGGATWSNMKNGIIDDSDVFSIIVDPKSPNIVYLSACSGIYKSVDAGGVFRKVQGMPYSARRTRMLHRDPLDANLVYAGTTEGLWRTNDAGQSWNRLTGANLIVNDILIDPANHNRVLLATDRSGVIVSTNGGESFSPSNKGFAHRQVVSILVDKDDESTVYAGLINDKEFGGVFVSRNSGIGWQQMSAGLNGLDIFALQQAANGDLIAGTNRGIYLYPKDGNKFRWEAQASPIVSFVLPAKRSKAAPRKVSGGPISARVNDIEIQGHRWYAATNAGIFLSPDQGKSWQRVVTPEEYDYIRIDANTNVVVACGRKSLYVSTDSGATWTRSILPANITGLRNVVLDDQSRIYIASREGAYRSGDSGATWEFLGGLPAFNLATIHFDAAGKRLLATPHNSTEIYESHDAGATWRTEDTGFILRHVRSAHGRLVAATAFDGVVVQHDAVAGSAVSSNAGNGNQR